MSVPRKQTIPGKGYVPLGREGRRLVVTFDTDTFDEIRGIALRRSSPMSEVIRELVQFGLIDLEDA